MILNSINVGPFNKAVGPGKFFEINKRRLRLFWSLKLVSIR